MTTTAWKCWRCSAENTGGVACDNCGAQNNAPERVKPATACAGCNETGVQLNTFHPDTPYEQDRGARLCASCWIPALRRRAGDTNRRTRCTVPGCDLEDGDHIEHCKRIAASAAWEVRFGSRRRPE